jgi:hypothetical protein
VFGRDREIAAVVHRGVGQLGGGVAGVGADPQPISPGGSGADRLGQRGQRPPEQVRGPGADVVVAGQQVGRHRQAGFRPVRQVRAAAALTGVVVGHALFAGAVDLHVRGVQVDRGPSGQLQPPLAGQHPVVPAGQRGDRGLHTAEPVVGEPAGQPGRGRRRRHRHRRQPRHGRVRPVSVQSDQGIRAQQLGLGANIN